MGVSSEKVENSLRSPKKLLSLLTTQTSYQEHEWSSSKNQPSGWSHCKMKELSTPKRGLVLICLVYISVTPRRCEITSDFTDQRISVISESQKTQGLGLAVSSTAKIIFEFYPEKIYCVAFSDNGINRSLEVQIF